MKRRTLLQHTGTLPLLSILAACGGGESIAPSPKTKTTLLVYLVASDLEGPAKRDLENMLKAASSANVNVVLQIGGGESSGDFPGVNMQEMRRYSLVPNAGTTAGWTLQPLPEAQQVPTVAMNLSQTLQDFIQWGAAQFPAERYALALWDHGGGPISGFGNDRAKGGGAGMSLSGISLALKNAGVPFELVGFDCCLMASLEVAADLAPYSRYLVASEEITTGWDWTAVLDYLTTHPQPQGDAFGRAIVNSYKSFTNETSDDKLSFTAYSVSQLDQAKALTAVLDQIAVTLQSAIATYGLSAWWAIAVARRKAQDFQSNIFSKECDLVDVKSWIYQLKAVGMLPDSLVRQFDAAFSDMVVYSDGGGENAFGLMMYFPRYSTLNTDLLTKYRSVPFSASYHALIDSYTSFASSDQLPYIQIGVPRLESGAALADVTVTPRPSMQKALPVLSRPFDEGFCALIADGKVTSMQPATAEERQIRLQNPQRWPMVQGQLITLLPDDPEDKELYYIPVAGGMLIAMRMTDEQFAINWFVEAQTYAGARAMSEIKPNKPFTPYCLDLSTNEWVSTGTVIVAPPADQDGKRGTWLVTMDAPPASQDGYTLQMVASDLTGQMHSSPQGIPLPT
ncbi:clostripain-related cysteine peptidase [Paracidovorax wautersii]|uniref:clostripain-related cysteine peptidase n=1 Tax=Paracidovorax wautersii TaxID=1177982 RepID=UPI0031D3F55E